jgi:hypothetical protein
MDIGDTGQRRRLVDRVSSSVSLELLGALAMETAARNGAPTVIRAVEEAVEKLRAIIAESEYHD